MLNYIPPPHDALSQFLLIAWLAAMCLFAVGLILLCIDIVYVWWTTRLERRKEGHFRALRHVLIKVCEIEAKVPDESHVEPAVASSDFRELQD